MDVSDDEMHGFDSDEERLEHLSSLMDSADTSQQQAQDSKERGSLHHGVSTVMTTYADDLLFVPDVGSQSSRQTVVRAAKQGQADDGRGGGEVSAVALQAKLLKMKAEMECMQRELDKQRQANSEGATCGQERCTPKPSSKDMPGSRRVAHSQAGNVSATLERLQNSASQRSLASRTNPPSRATPHLPTKQTDRSSDGENVMTEQFSKLRLRNPTLTKADMAAKMEGRVMIKIPRLPTKAATSSVDGNWVTIGVIVAKLPPKDSSKGNKYSVWKLSDLSSMVNVVTLFLFGEAHKEHWKVSLGDVVAVLNPSIKAEPKKERESGGIPFTLSLDHPHKLMVLGQSHDYTQCKASVKSTSKRCSNFANLSKGGFCAYHVHGAYKQTQATRGEFQAGYGPSNAAGLSRLKKKMKDENYFYCGASAASMSVGAGAPSKSSSQRLFVAGAEEKAAASKRNYLENQREGPSVKQKGGIMVSEGSDVFKQIMQSQCVGARNLHKFLRQEEEQQIIKNTSSLSATQVLQRQRSALLAASPLVATKGASTPRAATVMMSPKLGRGLVGCDDTVDLSEDVKLSKQKLKALSVLQKSGPITPVNPNCGSKGALSEAKKDSIRKRVLQGLAASDGPDGEEEAEQPRKKLKLDSDRLKQIIATKSSHDWEVQEEEMEKQQAYFEHLEKKEAMEQMMQSVTEKRVTVFQCAKCQYTAEAPSELCRKESHRLVRFKATKKFFECKDCTRRTVTYDKTLPSKACIHCGGMNFRKTGMMKEKKGPLLESEGLLVRGEEEKFLK